MADTYDPATVPFGLPSFPYPNLGAQFAASMQMPAVPNMGRYAYAGENFLGLPPSSYPTLYGGPTGGYPQVMDMNSPLLGGTQRMSMGNGLAGLLGALANSLPTHQNTPTPKAAPTGQFSNGLGLDPNNLPAMLGGGTANTPQKQWFVQQFNAMNPALNYSVGAFNNARDAGHNDLAYMMLAQGGEPFRQAVANADFGGNRQALNPFINSGFAQGGATAQYDPQTVAALRALGAT